MLSTPERKPRRNEPCWCGSGKKYKNCHLRQDEDAALATPTLPRLRRGHSPLACGRIGLGGYNAGGIAR